MCFLKVPNLCQGLSLWFAGCHKPSYANEGSVDYKMQGRVLDTAGLVDFLVGCSME
jgi:hypothetical protein